MRDEYNMLMEFRQDLLETCKQDELHEIQMRRDFEYALDYLEASDTVCKYRKLVEKLNDYGYDVNETNLWREV